MTPKVPMEVRTLVKVALRPPRGIGREGPRRHQASQKETTKAEQRDTTRDQDQISDAREGEEDKNRRT